MADTNNHRIQKFDTGIKTVTSYSYDVLGNLTEVVDDAGNTTTMEHDIAVGKTEMDDPDVGTFYDSWGRLTGEARSLFGGH